MTCGQDEYEARGSFAGSPSMVANRVSYYLDLRGPSIPVDTACSSSLTALHLAAQAIRTGECEAAVVGGCQINLRYVMVAKLEYVTVYAQRVLCSFVDWVNYSQGGILSEDGKCKPFDANADGSVLYLPIMGFTF
jgi:acyl transferase domain-containing protein